jgi:hypothetical protein
VALQFVRGNGDGTLRAHDRALGAKLMEKSRDGGQRHAKLRQVLASADLLVNIADRTELIE